MELKWIHKRSDGSIQKCNDVDLEETFASVAKLDNISAMFSFSFST